MFYFTPLPGFFSPFPRGTVSLSVIQEYLALRGGPRGFTQNFTCSMLLGRQKKYRVVLNDKTFTFYGIPFQIFYLTTEIFIYNVPTTPKILVQANPTSLAATKGIVFYFFFLQILRCFNSLGLLLLIYLLNKKFLELPHSEIHGL